MTKTGREFIEDVASRLNTATDDELGRAMAETAKCFKYGPKAPPCRERPLLKERCARCRVRMESDRRIAEAETRTRTTVKGAKNVVVVFKIAGTYQNLVVTSLLDIPVKHPALAGIGVLREPPPDVETATWPGSQVSFWRGDLVAWWRPCPDAEAQPFDVSTNGCVTHGISHKDEAIDPWLKKNRTKILVEVNQYADSIRGKLTRHVAGALAKHERLGREAQDRKLEKELEDEGVFDHDRYDAKDAEELGRMILSWSKIMPVEKDAIAAFIEAVQHSSIPEAAGEVGHAIMGSKRRS